MASLGLSNRVNDDNAKWYTLAAACFALFMAMLDNLVVNIALPTISRDLDARATQLQWVISAYTLVFASLQITAGGLGDRFGRKRWFMIGLVIFTAVSAVAAFSKSMDMLIVMRALQGLGAAFIMPLSLSLISNAFPPEERGRAIGIWSAVSVSSIALGPVVGGAIVEYFSWGWVFLINVPIGIVALLVTQAVVRESRDESGTVATDVPGTILITAGIASLTWGLIEAGERGWTDTWILAAFLAAAIILPVFIWVEMRTERPMIPMSFFRSRTFIGANIDSFMIAFLITGVSFFLTLYQQNIHGFSPIRTGLALVPMVAVMMVFSPLVRLDGQQARSAPADLLRHDRDRHRHRPLPAGRRRRLLLAHPAGLPGDGFRHELHLGADDHRRAEQRQLEKSGVASAVNGCAPRDRHRLRRRLARHAGQPRLPGQLQ